MLADIPDDNGTGPTLNPTNPLGDYAGLMAVGDDFYGVFCGNNTPDLANFPHGAHYQRNHNFGTKQLFDVSGVTPVTPPMIRSSLASSLIMREERNYTAWNTHVSKSRV